MIDHDLVENGTCWGCGTTLVKRSRTGPPPLRWCAEKCRRRHYDEFLALRREIEERRRQEAIGALLDELAPDGLTDECPARRGKVAA